MRTLYFANEKMYNDGVNENAGKGFLMSEKASADVVINGKVYTLAGYESKEYLQRVAAYINSKIAECQETEAMKRMPKEMQSVLLELNIADDYFKAKELVEKYEEDIASKEKEIYELRHEVIANQIKQEGLEKNIADLEEENKQLHIEKAKLEGNRNDI